jgi:LmbE family N-acetylglucosaminyl deacetylase
MGRRKSRGAGITRSIGLALLTFAATLSGAFAATDLAHAQARILVIAPHPDDDIITSAGVIYRARHSSPVVEVWVLYMTNGDVVSRATGLQRQAEAVTAQALLGVPEDHLVFLGYPDGSLQTLRSTNATTPYDSPNPDVGTTTNGNRGLGGAPYSRTRTGANATNTGANVIADLVHFLNARRPTDIFTVNENERHPDHITAYHFLMDVLPLVVTASYNPTVHRTAVWDDAAVWPQAPDATQYTAPLPPARQSRGDWGVDLPWAERESLDVPLVMQTNDWTQNIKARAIAAHVTQGGFSGRKDAGNISSFVHKDEIFWTARGAGTNRPPVPNAGLDQSAAAGTQVTLDGSASLPFDGDSLTYAWRQSDGPTVTLSSSTAARPTLTVPAVAAGTVLAFELFVGDGTSTSVADAVSVIVGAAPVDAGVRDAGTDSGTSTDSGADAGSIDGSFLDASSDTDASSIDSGAEVDAGAQLGDSAVEAQIDSGIPSPDTSVGDAAASEADAASTDSPTTAWPGEGDLEGDMDPAVLDDDGMEAKPKGGSGCSAATGSLDSDLRYLVLTLSVLARLAARRRSRASVGGRN